MVDEAFLAAVRRHAEHMVANAKQQYGLVLDYSPASLRGIASVATEYHKIYTRARAAKDPEVQKFLQQASFEITGYLGEVCVRHCGAAWAVGEKRDILLHLDNRLIPIHREVLQEIIEGRGSIQQMVQRVSGTARPASDPVSAAPPPPPPSSPGPQAAVEIGGREVIELQQQVKRGELAGLRAVMARMRSNREWQERQFIMDRVVPQCRLNVLDQACEIEPEQADVYLLRCAFFTLLAGETRGTKVVEQTPDRQFLDAAHCITDASRDSHRAIALDRDDPTPYSLVMRPLTIFGDLRPRLQEAYRLAVKLAPEFVQPHFSMVTAESERWGGTHQKSLEVARAAMRVSAPGSDMAACLFWAHTLAFTHLLAFDKDKNKAEAYRQDPAVRNELAAAFDRWVCGNYRPLRSSIVYFHYAAFWFYLAGDSDRLGKALAFTGGFYHERPWSMLGNAHAAYSKAQGAARSAGSRAPAL